MRRFAVGLAMYTIATLAPCWAHADDQQIAQTIISRFKEYKESGDLSGFDIDLRVKEGVVWLHGYVSESDQQDLVEDAALAVDGVKSVRNELTIRETAQAKPKLAVQQASATGKVDRRNDEANAPVVQVATETAPAEKSADVERAILEEASTDDSELAKSVAETLRTLKRDGKIRDFATDIEVQDGVVNLLGRVNSEEHQQAILEAVRYIPGVKKVVNELSIRSEPSALKDLSIASKPAETAPRPVVQVAKPMPIPTAYAQDANQIVEEIVSRLREKKDAGELNAFDLNVHCDRGSVWVSGQVPSADQAMLVLDTARRVPGVKQVVNNLSFPGNANLAYGAMPAGAMVAVPQAAARGAGGQRPLAFAPARAVNYNEMMGPLHHGRGMVPGGQVMAEGVPAGEVVSGGGGPMPIQGAPYGIGPARFDHPQLPGYSWPTYAAYPNYAAVTYPKQYSPTAWPYIGPFYPYPQVPLGWRKVSLEWDDGWWMLDFKDRHEH